MAESRYPPEVVSAAQGPEHGRTSRPFIPGKQVKSDYPLIDYDPHFRRVVTYARSSDYAWGGATFLGMPATMHLMERLSPTESSLGAWRSAMRLSWSIAAACGFLVFYSRSINRFYGFTENRREIELDMREMVGRVKAGEPLYGRSSLTEYMQGVAARQTRYTGVWLNVLPVFNFVNHKHHGVDTAKYYQQAERELEAERTGKSL